MEVVSLLDGRTLALRWIAANFQVFGETRNLAEGGNFPAIPAGNLLILGIPLSDGDFLARGPTTCDAPPSAAAGDPWCGRKVFSQSGGRF
jgi:hypothetical protein